MNSAIGQHNINVVLTDCNIHWYKILIHSSHACQHSSRPCSLDGIAGLNLARGWMFVSSHCLCCARRYLCNRL